MHIPKQTMGITRIDESGSYQNHLTIASQAARIGGRSSRFTIEDYQACYLDCSFDYPTDSLDQNLCFIRCDRRFNNPLPLLLV